MIYKHTHHLFRSADVMECMKCGGIIHHSLLTSVHLQTQSDKSRDALGQRLLHAFHQILGKTHNPADMEGALPYIECKEKEYMNLLYKKDGPTDTFKFLASSGWKVVDYRRIGSGDAHNEVITFQGRVGEEDVKINLLVLYKKDVDGNLCVDNIQGWKANS